MTTPLNILILCGSYHKQSANRAILDTAVEALRGFTKKVSAFESIPLDSIAALNPTHFQEPAKSIRELRKQLTEADGVIIAAPEYAGGLAGSVKNALDWCVGSETGFYEKPVALMSTGTTGGAHALKQLTQTLLWQNAHISDVLGISAPQGKRDESGKLVDKPTIEAIFALTERLVDSLTTDKKTRALRSQKIAHDLEITDYPHTPLY